jgi:hypothetical protein
MSQQAQPLSGFPLTVNIYAHDQQEVEQAREALCTFIRSHALQGRAVTAGKITAALSRWDSNILVRNAVVSFLSKP